MDIISKIHQPLSMKYNYILIAMYYFTKWVKVSSYRSTKSRNKDKIH
jgi:hypothetical protein